MNKIKIYEGMISLSENGLKTLVKVIQKDSTILITAYNKKLRFTSEELLVHLNMINKSKELEEIYYKLQQPFNNVNYNLQECFKYIKEFITFTTQGLMFKCQKLQNYINPTLDQSTKTIQKFLNKQLTKQIHEPITKPMVVIKLGQNNYATLFQKNDLLFLKFHQAKAITNLIQYHKVITSKFGKICQDNFNQIFDVTNNILSYTELAQFYIEISNRIIVKTIPMSKYNHSAKVIQKHIRNYLLFRQVQIYQLRNKFINLITKVKLIQGIGYYLQLSIEVDNYNNQQIFIRAKPIEHNLRFYNIQAFKQKLFLHYTEAQLRMGGSIMLQHCHIQQIKSLQKTKTIMFEHALGLLQRSNEFNDRDPTIDQRILISKSIQSKYKQQQITFSECGSSYNFNNLKYDQLISKVQIQYRKHQFSKEYEYEQGLKFQFYSNYSIPPIHLFSPRPDTSCSSENNTTSENKEIDVCNKLMYLSQTGKNGIKIKHYIDSEQLNFIIILEQLLNRCSCKISLNAFQSEYLLKLVSNSDKTKIYRFMKDMLNQLDNLIFLRSSILDIHLEQFNLNNLLQDSMIVKIQKKIRILHFHNSLLRRSQSLLLRVVVELSQNQFQRTIYRLKGNTIRILYNKQLYCLDLNELQTISPQLLTPNKKEYFYILKQLTNFSEFINSDMNIQDISFYRLKFNFLINLIQDHTVYKNGFLDFSIKLPIKLTTQDNKKKRPLINNRNDAVRKLQQFFKKQFYKNQIRYLLKTKSKTIFNTRSMRKIGQTYYIIYGSKEKDNLSFDLIQYKCSTQRFKISEKKRSQLLLNFGQQSLLKFYISKLTFKGDQLVFQFQDLTQIDLYEKHKSEKNNNKSRRQYQSRLIDVKRSGNQVYNVVYSQSKLCSQSIDCIKVDINMNKFKYLYKSVSAKKDTLQTIADNSLKSISYQDDKVYVDRSLIMPQRLKLSQKPQFKINTEKVVRRNPRMENLVKTTVRFNKMKYLLQINYQSSKIHQIIPEAMDTVYQNFEQNFIISSINFEDKTTLEWNLSYENAQKLTEQSDKYRIAEILKQNLQILNNRFLYLIQKDSDVQFEDIIIMNEISIRKMQRYCMNRTFRKNYYFYRFIRLKYKQYYLLQIDQLRSKNQYLIFVAEDPAEQKLFLYIWELDKFQLITIELPKNNYLSFWNQNKIACVKALLQLVVINQNKVFLKKINQLGFKYIFEQII